MTGHNPAPAPVHAQPALPNQPFSSWLRTQTTLFISQIAAILGMVYFIVSLIYYASGASEHSAGLFTPKNIQVVVNYAHIVFMALFILVLIRYLDDNSKGEYRVARVYERVFGKLEKHGQEYKALIKNSKDRLRSFKRRFLWFWIMMLALYVTFAAHRVLVPSLPHTPPSASLNVRDANADPKVAPKEQSRSSNATVYFGLDAFCAHAPWYRLVPPWVGCAYSNKQEREPLFAATVSTQSDYFSATDLRLSLIFPWLEFLFNNLSLLFIFRCFLVMSFTSDDDGKARRYGWAGTITVVVLTILYPVIAGLKLGGLTAEERTAFIALFDALSGVLNAVFLALLIARLDSKLIGLPSILISILYSYAAIQPLFVAFNQEDLPVLEQITASVLIFVLVSKIYFFLIIMYSLQTGRMLNYLFCFSTLRSLCAKAETKKRNERPTQSEKSKNNVMALLDRIAAWASARMGRWVRDWVDLFRQDVDWALRSHATETVGIWLGWVAIAVFVFALLGYALVLGSPKWARPYDFGIALRSVAARMDIVQLLVVGMMFALLFILRLENGWGIKKANLSRNTIFQPPLDDSNYRTKEAKSQLQKFKEYFLWFLGITLVLYAILHQEHLSMTWPPDHEFQYLWEKIELLKYPGLVFILSTLNLLFVFWCFVVVQSPSYDDRSFKRQKLLANYSTCAVLLLIAVFLLLLCLVANESRRVADLLSYVTVFDGITGTLSGVALALLIARIDSKLFGLRWSSVCILFTYASIQPLFVVFELHGNVFSAIETFVLVAALLLKTSFFLIILHVLQSGKMLNYLLNFPILRDRVNSIFENQFEIRIATVGPNNDLYGFSIWKKNTLVYSTGAHFSSREECDKVILDLRALMQTFDQMQPDEVAGTYWVNILIPAPAGPILCESTPLRSEDERADLIEQSKQNIPYCKYNRA